MKRYEAIIIGFGKAGKTLAAFLGNNGTKVALIEQSEDMYGGTCINVGCLPTKFLIEKSHGSIGHSPNEQEELYRNAILAKRKFVTALRAKNLAKLRSVPNVDIIVGQADFETENRVNVTDPKGNVHRYEAPRIYINTGSRPTIPIIEGIRQSKRVYTSTTLMELDRLPKRLAILGSGNIAIEFASMFANFGSEVTILMRSNHFLNNEEPEIAAAVRESFEKRGIVLKENVSVEKIESARKCDILSLYHANGKTERFETDALLVATGRRPNTEDLKAEKIGIDIGPRGEIIVDKHLRTSAASVRAMGDVTGGPQFTYISLDDFRIIRSEIEGKGERSTDNRPVIPRSIFVEPPFSSVGLTEKAAKKAGYKVMTAVIPAAAIPKAILLGRTEGLLKAVVDEETHKVLGVHLFCESSHEIIGLLALAIEKDTTFEELRDAIYTHPTITEGLNDLFAAVR